MSLIEGFNNLRTKEFPIWKTFVFVFPLFKKFYIQMKYFHFKNL